METNDSTRERIETIIASDRVVLFMKGTREMPQCGFSAATIGVLDALVPSYSTVNVLEDQAVREGIKAFSDWPTIPQLYVDGEFLGGCDIVKQMFNTGELHRTLGLEEPDRTPPQIEVSDRAAEMIRDALGQAPAGMAVHLQVDSRWGHDLRMGPEEGHEIRAQSNGIVVLMDVATAQRARGIRLDLEEGVAGVQLKIENPNAPAAA